MITEEDLVGPLAGFSLSDLVDEMQNGNTYVNVHTSDFSGRDNTGPGDFPAGEIRGQIVADEQQMTRVQRRSGPGQGIERIRQLAIDEYVSAVGRENLPDPLPSLEDLNLSCEGDFVLTWKEDEEGNYVPDSWDVCCGEGCR
jgi:hypothetical protein